MNRTSNWYETRLEPVVIELRKSHDRKAAIVRPDLGALRRYIGADLYSRPMSRGVSGQKHGCSDGARSFGGMKHNAQYSLFEEPLSRRSVVDVRFRLGAWACRATLAAPHRAEQRDDRTLPRSTRGQGTTEPVGVLWSRNRHYRAGSGTQVPKNLIAGGSHGAHFAATIVLAEGQEAIR
ncbi:hypothetical protein [Sphingobium aromaticiconvertens]|uniref:hypothetical protein n=1 Tax=Sphingobium aromaticiconvertens TaxID=365341 RepID=UPI00301B529F